MKGFTRANLMYMRAFADAWRDGQIVQQLVGQLISVAAPSVRLARHALKDPYLFDFLEVGKEAGERSIEQAAVDAQFKSEHDAPTIGLLLCRTKNRVVAEYARA